MSELKMVRALRQEVELLNQAVAETEAHIARLEEFAVPKPHDDGPPPSGPRPDTRGGVA